MIYRWWSAPHQNLRKGSRFPTLKRPCLRDRGAGNDWPTGLVLPSFWPNGSWLVFNVFVALFGFCISIGQFSFHLMSLLDREAEKHQWSMCRKHRFEVAFVEASIAWYRGEPLMSEDWLAIFELSERCCLKFDGFIEVIMVLHLQSVCKNPSFQTMPQHRPLSVVSPGRVSRLESKGSGLWTTQRCNGDMAHTQAKWTREVQGELVSRKFILMFRPKGASVQELFQNDLIEPDLWNRQFDTSWFSSYLSFVHSLVIVHFSFLRVFLHLILSVPIQLAFKL